MSPAKRRRAVAHARAELRVSERRACRVVGQARATQRYVPTESPDERALLGRIVALATRFGEFDPGYTGQASKNCSGLAVTPRLRCDPGDRDTPSARR